MKRSAVWPWRKVGFFSMVAVFAFIALQYILGGYWHVLADVALYTMWYAMGRQHQSYALGIRMLQFIKKHHEKDEAQPWI